MADARDTRRRVVWPLLVLLFAGAMIVTNRSSVVRVAVSDAEVEQWVVSWAQPHIEGAAQPLPTANPVLDAALSRRLRAMSAADSASITVTVLTEDASTDRTEADSRRVRIDDGLGNFVVITVHQLRSGSLVVSGVMADDADTPPGPAS